MDDRWKQMIAHLWRGGANGYLWTPDGEEHTEDGKTWRDKLTLWFPAQNEVKVPKTWAANCNAYFGVHPTKSRGTLGSRGGIEDIAAVNCLFADFDIPRNFLDKAAALARIGELPFQPSFVVDSGGGIHVYWLLANTYIIDTDVSRERIQALQYAWVDYVGGDQGAKDIAHVLRVPGTYNRKPQYGPDFPQVQFITSDLTRFLSVEDAEAVTADLRARQPKRTAKQKPTQNRGGAPADSEFWTVAFGGPYGAEVRALFNGDLSSCGGDHSIGDYELSRHLGYYTNGNEWEIDRLFRQSGLYRDKWDRDDYRERTIQRAIAATSGSFDWVAWRDKQNAVATAQAAVGVGTPYTNGNGHHHTNGNGAGAAQTSKPLPGGIPLQSGQDFFTTESADQEGHARCVFHLYGDKFRHCSALGWMHYNGKFWEAENADLILDRCIVDTLIQRRIAAVARQLENIVKESKVSAYNVSGTKKLFQSMVYASLTDFDASPDLLNCNNGVLNLKTGTLTPHSSDQLFTYAVPVDYDPSADYVEWLEWLATITTEEFIDYLKLAIGYSLTGHTSEECLFYLFGETRSGKGTFTETLLSLLPRPLGVGADFTTFTSKRDADTQNFDLAPLKPARIVIASESKKNEPLNEAKVKSITGGDWIRCAYKHRDHFEYRPQFKLWLASNYPSNGDVDDAAFWGRIRVIEFPNSFLGMEDKSLKHKMKSDENLRGVLAWAVEGAVQWYASKSGLPHPPAVVNATRKHRNMIDYVQQWLDECCDYDVNGKTWTSNAALHASYTEWCARNGVAAKQNRGFGQALSGKKFITGVMSYLPNGKRAKGVTGISIV